MPRSEPAAACFLRQAEQRLAEFYADLARWGEVAPGVRFRLEGFLDAGLSLQLVELSVLQGLIEEQYQAHLGQLPEQPGLSAAAVTLPVRWVRAPVYAGGSPK